MKTGLQIASAPLESHRWHRGDSEPEAPSAISNPPRFRGKLTSSQGLEPARYPGRFTELLLNSFGDAVQ